MKKNLIILLLYFLFSYQYVSTQETEATIKLYALYTPSHKILLDEWFLPSIQDDYEVILDYHDQECRTGTFMQTGWTKTTRRKVDFIIQAVKDNIGKIFVFSDVDIQFFGKTKDIILKLIKDKDMVIQRNDPSGRMACSGFFACRGNKRTLKLWQDVKAYMIKSGKSDQAALNYVLRKTPSVVWNFLPVKFFGGGTLTGRIWEPRQKLPIPDDIIMHHANWTTGINNKIAQLRYVRDYVTTMPKKQG